MAVAKSVIAVDPSGRSMVVDIQNMAGASQTTYDATDGGNVRTLPLTINSLTLFCLASAGDYQVSAKIGGLEIAGANGTKRAVTPPRDGTVTVTPLEDPGELLDLTAGAQAVLVGGSGTLWAANTAAPAGTVLALPTGFLGTRITGAPTTTRAQWDATEAGYWITGGLAPSIWEGVNLQARGHSYLPQPPVFAQAGGDPQTRLSIRLGLGTVSTYAKSASHMLELFYDALNTAQPGAGTIANSVAGTNLSGLILIDGFANDIFNYNGATFTPASPTALRQKNAQDSLTALIALVCASSRVESEAGTTTGVWTPVTATDPWGGRTLQFTTAQNAKIDIPVTFNASGVAWLISYGLSTGAVGAHTVAVDGGTQYTTASATLCEQIKSNRNGSTQTYTAAPIPYRLTASAGAHTVTITKTDAGAGPVYVDEVLVQSTTPPLVVVADDPIPVSGASAPFLTAQNLTDIAAAKASWTTTMNSGIAPFSNAYRLDLSSLSSLTYLSSLDGVHPNDRGMKVYCDLLAARLAQLQWAFSAGLHKL